MPAVSAVGGVEGRRPRIGSGRRFGTRNIGEGRFLDLATRRRECWWWGLRLRLTAPTGRAACSPGIAPETGCTGRCTRRASPTKPASRHREDGLALRGAYVTAGVRCAPPGNRPSTQERDRCLPFLHRELSLLGENLSTVVALGGFAFSATLRALVDRGIAPPKPRPKFGHGVEATVGPLLLLGSYHPSQQNTFTGRLTEAMFDAVWRRAADRAGPTGGYT